MGVAAASATRLREGFHLRLVLPTSLYAYRSYGSVAVTLADFYDMLDGSMFAYLIVLGSTDLLRPCWRLHSYVIFSRGHTSTLLVVFLHPPLASGSLVEKVFRDAFRMSFVPFDIAKLRLKYLNTLGKSLN